MKIRDITIRAGRSLKQAKSRTILTSLAIAVGAFTITLSLAAGAGGRSYTDQIVSANTNTNELMVTKTLPTSQQGPQKYSASNPTVSNAVVTTGVLTQDDINQIKQVADVVSVLPNYNPQIEYVTRSGADKYVVSTSTFSPSVTLQYAAGSIGNNLADNEIILTEDYVKALGFGNDQAAIGKTVDLVALQGSSPINAPQTKTFTYTVRAISSQSGLAFRSQSSLLIPATSAKVLYDYINQGTRGYNLFREVSVEVTTASKAQTVKDAITKKGYIAQTAADILGAINTFINVLQGILLGFGALAVLTSVFGIINTQYISVLERTQQIGLMKALGMRRKDVGRLFKLEAAWIGFLGSAIGSALAVVAGTIANPHISKALNIGDIRLLIFQPLSVATVIIGLVLVAVLSGILPARKASKLDPIEALRTE